MQWIRATFNVEGNKFHVAGISSGGRSAFRIALDYTEHIQSVTVLPGYPPLSIDYTHLDRLKYIPVTMFVGENDDSFLRDMIAAYNRLKEFGAKWARLEIMSDEDHVIESLTSERLFQILENARPKI
jgi:pimeloyl-ACP methyl ester carboxylesterase